MYNNPATSFCLWLRWSHTNKFLQSPLQLLLLCLHSLLFNLSIAIELDDVGSGTSTNRLQKTHTPLFIYYYYYYNKRSLQNLPLLDLEALFCILSHFSDRKINLFLSPSFKPKRGKGLILKTLFLPNTKIPSLSNWVLLS